MSGHWQTWTHEHGITSLIVRDVGGGGDCQFLVISAALQSAGYDWSVRQLRKLVGKCVLKMTDDDFKKKWLVFYQGEANDGVFCGRWNPFKCTSKEQLCKAVELPNKTGNGFDFQGDAMTLDLLGPALNVNFIVFHKNRDYAMEFVRPECDNFILMLFHQSGRYGHYQLLGSPDLDGNVVCLFSRRTLPKDVVAYLRRRLPPAERKDKSASHAANPKQQQDEHKNESSLSRAYFNLNFVPSASPIWDASDIRNYFSGSGGRRSIFEEDDDDEDAYRSPFVRSIGCSHNNKAHHHR